MEYTSTSLVALSAQAEAFQTAARSSGIAIDLDQQSATEMYSDDGVRPSAGPGNYYGGGFSSKVVDGLITEVHLHSGLSHLFALEDYVSRDVAALWWPTGDNQISVIRDTLRGWSPQSPFGSPRPSRWYFVHS